jgi:putative RNA 2'-phosphotransferase
MDDDMRMRLSKKLTFWLRHKPEHGKLTLSKEGWVPLAQILEALKRQGDELQLADLLELIRHDEKERFEIEDGRIRARYGHSIPLEVKPHPGTPPATLYHGTTHRYLPKILEMGLRPMKRQFVHLSPSVKIAREVGCRRDQTPVVLSINAHAAHQAGIQFYPRGRGIWLSDPIPPKYLTIVRMSDRSAKQRSRNTAFSPSTSGMPRRRRPRHGFIKELRSDRNRK